MDLNNAKMNHQFPDEWGIVSVQFRNNIVGEKIILDCEYKCAKLTFEDGIYYITSPRGSVTCIPFECVRSISFYTNTTCNIDSDTYLYKTVFDFSPEMENNGDE